MSYGGSDDHFERLYYIVKYTLPQEPKYKTAVYVGAIDAVRIARQRYDDAGDQDAFRHALWSAFLTTQIGEEYAEMTTTAYENLTPNNPEDQKTMDLYNNAIGRAIVKLYPEYENIDQVSEIADKVQNFVDNGACMKIVNGKFVPTGESSSVPTISPTIPIYREMVTNDVKYPLHFKETYGEDDANEIIYGDGWSDIVSPQIESKWETNKWQLIGSIVPPESIDIKVTSTIGISMGAAFSLFSFILGAFKSYLDASTVTRLKLYQQQKSNEKRALLIFDSSALSYSHFAGETKYLRTEIVANLTSETQGIDPNFDQLYQDWLKDTFELPDISGRTYDLKLSFDSDHSSDPGIGLINKNINDELILYPFVHNGDYAKIVYSDGALSAYKELKDVTHLLCIPSNITGEARSIVEGLLNDLGGEFGYYTT